MAMTTWITTELRYVGHSKKIRELCTKHFGHEWKKTRNNITGVIRDNHGNWRFDARWRIQFRYPRDYTMFLMLAADLGDVPFSWETEYRKDDD